MTLKSLSHVTASVAVLCVSMLTAPQPSAAAETVEITLVCGKDFDDAYVDKLAMHLQGRNSRLKVKTIGPHLDPDYKEFVRVYMYESFLLTPYLRQAIDNGSLELAVLHELAIHDKYISSPPTPITRKEAFQASLGRVVLHHGNGIEGVDRVAAELRQNRIDAIAASGGADGRLEILAQRQFPLGYDCCSQKQVADGTAGILARRLFDAKKARELKRLLTYIDSSIVFREAQAARLDREYSEMEQRRAEIERRSRAIEQVLGGSINDEDSLAALLRDYEKRTGVVVDRKSKAEVTKALMAYRQLLIQEQRTLKGKTE